MRAVLGNDEVCDEEMLKIKEGGWAGVVQELYSMKRGSERRRGKGRSESLR